MPEQLALEHLEAALPLALELGRRLPRRVPHLHRRQLAPMQVRRQHRGSGRIAGDVAGLAVAVEPLAEEVAQPRRSTGLAGGPGVAQAAGPVRLRRQQVPVREAVALRRPVRARDAPRRRQRRFRIGQRPAAVGERRVDGVAATCLGPDRIQIEQGRHPVLDEADAVRLQRPRDRFVLAARPGLVHQPALHAAGADLAGELRDDAGGIAPAQDQPGPGRLDVMRQRRQAVMQPPARGAPGRPVVGRRPVQHEHREHGSSLGECRGQGAVVGQAQILSEPEQRHRVGALVRVRRPFLRRAVVFARLAST